MYFEIFFEKEIWLLKSSESIIGATIKFAKLLASIEVKPTFFRFLPLWKSIVTYELIEMNFQLFCKNGHQLLISSFLSCRPFSLFCFFDTCWRMQCKNQIHFPIFPLFLQMKASYKCSLTCFTIQNVFINLLADFIEEKPYSV